MTVHEVDILEPRGDIAMARLNGEIDMANTGWIGHLLHEAVSNDHIGVVIDLSGLRYIDSTGIRMLFGIARRLDQGRQGMAVALPVDSHVGRLIKITRLDEVAFVGSTVDECIPGLRSMIHDRFS